MCLDRVEKNYADRVAVEWKSFLLRPYAEEKDLDAFRHYTQSWSKPAGQEGGGRFRPWSTDEAPPSHSVPPNVAVKAAARQGAFGRYHLALMDAYFYDNRNVTAVDTILDVARAGELDMERFQTDLADPALVEAVAADHNEAVARGVTGVPAVVAGDGFMIPGSQEERVYGDVIERMLAKGLV